jgi:hypothetical protein
LHFDCEEALKKKEVASGEVVKYFSDKIDVDK